MLQIRWILVLASVSLHVPAQSSNEVVLKACAGAEGICLPIHICPSGVYSENGAAENASSIVIQLDRPNACDDPLQICCHNAPERFEEEEVASRLQNLTDAPPENVLSEAEYESCGIRNPAGLVYGGVESNLTYARYGEFPWMVAIFRTEAERWEENRTLLYAGGGALIHPRFVLTSAEVLRKPGTLYARLGEWCLESSSEKYATEDVEIVERTGHGGGPHEGYDVGLARLKHPVPYRRHIRPICLPGRSESFEGLRCLGTGWGKDVRTTNESPKLLKVVELPVVPRRECIRMLRNIAGLGPEFELHRTFLCAGGEEEGVDMGEQDGGSPLVCRRANEDDDDGSYVIAGIVSWGVGKFGRRGIPGVYTDVSKVARWIEAQSADRDW